VLARFGLTPARFDLLVAVGTHAHGTPQRALPGVLGVVRSSVSELVAAVEKCGLLRRVRSLADRRTWSLRLTARGAEVLAQAYEECINRGFVPLTIDRVLTNEEPEVDCQEARFSLIGVLSAFQYEWGRAVTRELYMWHPDDYLAALVVPGETAEEVPWVA